MWLLLLMLYVGERSQFVELPSYDSQESCMAAAESFKKQVDADERKPGFARPLAFCIKVDR